MVRQLRNKYSFNRIVKQGASERWCLLVQMKQVIRWAESLHTLYAHIAYNDDDKASDRSFEATRVGSRSMSTWQRRGPGLCRDVHLSGLGEGGTPLAVPVAVSWRLRTDSRRWRAAVGELKPQGSAEVSAGQVEPCRAIQQGLQFVCHNPACAALWEDGKIAAATATALLLCATTIAQRRALLSFRGDPGTTECKAGSGHYPAKLGEG